LTSANQVQPRQSDERRERIVWAIAHPLRQEVLRILNERVASPKQIADELNQRIPNASYHTRVLLDSGCIELVDTKPRRGAVEHFYRALVRPMLDDDQWRQLPLSVRRSLFGQTLRYMLDHLGAAANAGGLDHPQAHVSWTPLELYDKGWDDMAELLGKTLERAMAISAASSARWPRGPSTGRGEQRSPSRTSSAHRDRFLRPRPRRLHARAVDRKRTA